MTDEYLSEQRRHYTQKNIDKSILRNPSVKCNALHFIKPYADTYLRLAPKPLQETKSVYKNDFYSRLQVDQEKMALKLSYTCLGSSKKLRIDRSKPGYTKYLDVSATSNRLDYFPFSYDLQRGIGAKDNITYWNWIKNETNKKYNVWPIKQKLLNKFNDSKHSERRRGEFQIMQNSVPNSGLTTETKSNFRVPDRSLDIAFKCISDELDTSDKKTVNV